MEEININLYEKWVKKPIMISILKESKKKSLNDLMIYSIMIDTIITNIKSQFGNLTKERHQLEFYKNMLHKNYTNIHNLLCSKDINILSYYFYYYYYHYQFKELLNQLINYDTPKEYLPIEIFFRGIHQIIEIVLLYFLNIQDQIELLLNIDIDKVNHLIYNNIQIWSQLIDLLNLLVSMDELKYQKYRNLIYGTSGGESINLRLLQKKIQNLDKHISLNIHDTIINNHPDKYLISSIKLYQYYSTQFWLTHFNLAASTNGIQNKGTKETPIIKLIDKCINMTDTRINNVLCDISLSVRDDTIKKKVIINNKEKLIGLSIYNSVKDYLNI